MFAKYPAIRHLRWASAASVLMLGACGGDSMPNSAAPAPSSTPPMMPASGSSPPPLMATFDSIQANIFTPICAGCHGGANPPENLNLDATHSYNDLINVPSTEDPSIVRVKPGSPSQSYLVLHIQKEGDGASATDLSFIEQWITDGAPPSTTATAMAMAMADKFEIAAVQPDSGDVENVPPPRIIVGFTQELDANLISGGSVLLERIEDDAAPQAAATPIPATISMPAGNARALLVTPSSALTPGNYQVVMNPAGGAELASIGGVTLSAPASGVNGERVLTRFSVAAGGSGNSPGH
jgi:hypothetical protein